MVNPTRITASITSPTHWHGSTGRAPHAHRSADGGPRRRRRDTDSPARGARRISGLAWSPDGTRIAYTHTWAACPDGEDGIWVLAAHGSSQPTQLIARGSARDWSQDGATIACTSESELWLMDSDGQNLRRITAGGP
jgi:hypothetical protein